MTTINSNESIMAKEDAKYLQSNSCDAYDYLLAVACGAIGGLVDIFFVGVPGDSVLGKWSDQQADNSELDRGDGVCRYLVGNLCSIYPSRPLLCRIDESYDYFFKDSMTREEFYRANLQVCSKLKTKRT